LKASFNIGKGCILPDGGNLLLMKLNDQILFLKVLVSLKKRKPKKKIFSILLERRKRK